MKKIVFGVILVSGLVEAELRIEPKKEWTFMVYLDGDNNLEKYGIDDFLEMAQIGSTDKINIIVQFDRVDGYDMSYGDWKTTKRFYITQGMTPTATNAILDIGEANMGATQTVIDFIGWAKTDYPAKRYALVFWNHGGGWRKDSKPHKAVCWDKTSNDCLYMAEVKEALAGEHFDIIGFDACFMGMVEVAYQLKDCGTVAVFSQEVEPGDGWPYNTILADLVGTPTFGAKDLGRVIVERYIESYDDSYVTQSAVDLTQLGTVATKISDFADSLNSHYDELKVLRANTDDCGAYADIFCFASLASSISKFQDSAESLKSAISDSIIAEGHRSGHPDFHGMNIYFPKVKDEEYDDYVIDRVACFPQDTTWDEFLARYYESSSSAIFTGSFTDIGIDTDNDSKYNYLQLSLEINVRKEGAYSVEVGLELGSDSIGIGASQPLMPGTQTISLQFRGEAIFKTRVDGPYRFIAKIYKGGLIDKFSGYTGTYTYTQFEIPSILTGSISYSGTKTGNLYVLLSDNPEITEDSIDYYTMIKTPIFPQSYEIIDIRSGTYYVVALLDADENNEPSIGDPVGMYGTLTSAIFFWEVIGTPTPCYIQDGSITQGIDFALTQEIIGLPGDAWDPMDDTAGSATLLIPTTSEQSHGPHTLSSTDPYDWYKMHLVSGTIYNFNTIGGSGDNYGELYDGPGTNYNRVAYDDDSGGNRQFNLSYQAEKTQDYYLRMKRYSSGSWSGYLKYSYKGTTEESNIISVSNAEGGLGQTITVPIRIHKNKEPIDAFGMDLIYDEAMLLFVGLGRGDLTAHFSCFDGTETASGTIRIGGFDPMPISTDSSGIIAEAIFSVIYEEEGTSILYLSQLKDDLKGFGVISGIFTSFPHHGDVNNDNEITPDDALIAFKAYLGLYPLTNYWQRSVADRNKDGEVTPKDALITFKEYLGIKSLFASQPTKLNTTQIISVRSATDVPCSSVVIRIDLESNDRQVDAFGLELLYDPNILVYREAKTGILTENPIFFDSSIVSTGTVRIGWFGTATIGSAGSFLDIIFDIKPDANGSCNLTLSNLKDDIKGAGTISGRFVVEEIADNLLNVQVYPNPCKGGDRITFTNLTAQATIRIFNIAGEEIERLKSNTWYLPPKLASGVYIYLITDKNQRTTGKIGIVK
ncbi:MAG: clostripain-related cysteine peptidase [bacterium]|nr:clostripain-related cysteine peptidase [bacterium]